MTRVARLVGWAAALCVAVPIGCAAGAAVGGLIAAGAVWDTYDSQRDSLRVEQPAT